MQGPHLSRLERYTNACLNFDRSVVHGAEECNRAGVALTNWPGRDLLMRFFLRHISRKIGLAFAVSLPAIAVFGLLSWSSISRMLVSAGYLPRSTLVSAVEVGPSTTQVPGAMIISTGNVALQLHGGVRFSEGVLIFDGESGFVSTEPIGVWACKRLQCLVDLKVSFEELPPPGRSALLVGQSRTPGGWHLLYHNGKLILQGDGGASELSGAWEPTLGRSYQIEIFSVGPHTTLRIDGRVIARAGVNAMLSSKRGFTFGGRGGPSPLPFHGRMQNVRLAVGPL
jgi:hypothetical protein